MEKLRSGNGAILHAKEWSDFKEPPSEKFGTEQEASNNAIQKIGRAIMNPATDTLGVTSDWKFICD